MNGKLFKSRMALANWIVLSLIMILIAGGAGLASAKDSKYVGAGKCKNCHDSKSKGDQYAKWKEMKHAKAYETLASDAAKEVGQKQEIADPQKSDKCLKCHVTAYEESADRKDKKFDMKLGVQCESCHGAGGAHVKARLAAAAEGDDDDLFGDDQEEEITKIPAGEIVASPKEDLCKKCHNKESPSFKDFKFDERKKKIEHPDPRKKK